MHKTSNLQDGYLGSGKILKRSLNKHGKENHTFEILEYLDDLESLIKKEREIVNETLLSDKMCMNLKIGGMGGFAGEENRIKAQAAGGRAMSAKAKEAFINKLLIDEKFKEKISSIHSVAHAGEKNGFYGKTHTDEHREKMRNVMKKHKGENNSQYGTCWITKDFENKKIKKDELQIWLDKGWIKGRFVEKNKK
jgi:hypothetical protein